MSTAADLALCVFILIISIGISGLSAQWAIDVSMRRPVRAALIGGALDTLRYVELLLIVVISIELVIPAIVGGMIGTYLIVKQTDASS